MSGICIIIPTCNRPRLLRTALSSVLTQTILTEISEVVVIENGGNRDSEATCREFKALPIRYVFRSPPIPPEKSARPIVAEMSPGLVAILHDDDWWDSRHLEQAAGALKSSPNASAYFSSAFFTKGESQAVSMQSVWLQWFAVSGVDCGGLYRFSLEDAIAGCLLNVLAFYSGLVTTKAVWENCLPIFDHGNPNDTDRLLFVEFAKHGQVIFNTRPTAYWRRHPNQESSRLHSSGEHMRWWQDTTQRILACASDNKIDVRQLYANRGKACNTSFGELSIYDQSGSLLALHDKGLLPSEWSRQARIHRPKAFVKRMLKRLM